jgi:WD40 repeat protein
MNEKKESRKSISVAKKNERPEVYTVKRVREDCDAGRRRFLTRALGVAGAAAALANSSATTHAAETNDEISAPVLPGSCQNGKAHHGYVYDLVFSKDGTKLASCSFDKKVKFWTHPEGRLLKSFDHQWSVNVLKGDAKGQWLAAAYSSTIVLYKWAGPSKQKMVDVGGTVSDLVFSPTGKRLAVLAGSKVLFFSIPGLKQIGSMSLMSYSGYCLAVSHDGKRLAVGCSGQVEIYSLKNFKSAMLKQILYYQSSSILDWFYGAAFSLNGKYLAAACYDGVVKIWNTSNWAAVRTINTGLSSVQALSLDAKSKLMAVGGKEIIKLYSFPKGRINKTLTKLFNGDVIPLYSLTFDNSSNLLAAGYGGIDKGHLLLWQHANGQILRCFADLDATPVEERVKTYQYKAADGSTVTITIPNCSCATQLPADAKCTCDTVKGNYCECVGYCGCHGVYTYYYPS